MTDNSSVPTFFASDEATSVFIKSEEVRTCTKFVALKSRNLGITDIQSLHGYKIWWEDSGHPNALGPNIPFDGLPFVVMGNEMKECQHGPDRFHQKKKRSPDSRLLDHNQCLKGRRIFQPSKKHDCTAKIRMRKILKFPSFHLDENTKWKRQKMVKRLKESFSKETPREYRVYISMPSLDEHESHLMGELAGYSQNIDADIIKKIHELVGDGVKRVDEMKRHIDTYVQHEILPQFTVDIPPSNRRFYPTDKDIRNHMYEAITATRFSKNDQENLRQLVARWQEEAPRDKFFYRPVSSVDSEITESFLFMHQSEWQKRLLDRYGHEICLLDATYNTTNYDLPLFFLCVNTNVGFSIVASFLLGKETKTNIKEALGILSKWNPNWKPAHFMCDFDNREFGAIEGTFPECFVYTCDFHREQSWERWLKNAKHGVSSNNREEILSLLRAIARASTEEEYAGSVDKLRTSDTFVSNKLFSNWIEKSWLSQHKRWVYAFRKHLFNIRVNTTNGLERQHREFKENYLKNYAMGKSLSAMLDILIKKFLPDSMNRYIRYNVESLETYRKYSPDIPLFLHNRPKKFLLHCLDRMPPCIETITSIRREQSLFYVLSPQSGIEYTVQFREHMPCCSCPDWQKSHWPCKHMLAVFQQYPDQGWDSLPKDYTTSPYFSLDTEFIQDKKETSNLTNNQGDYRIEESGPTSPITNFTKQDCLDLVKNITSGIYGVTDICLNAVHQELVQLDNLITKNQDMSDGLPIRHNLRKKKKPSKRKTKRKFDSKLRENNVEVNEGEDTAETVLFTTNDTKECDSLKNDETETFLENDIEKGDEYQRTISKIWRNRTSYGYLVSKVGPYNIYDSSIVYLKSTLSDEVIDSYLYLLTTSDDSVRHIDSLVMTAILNGEHAVHSMLKKVDIYAYETVIGAYNEGGSHWTLVIFHPKTKSIIYMNPLGELFMAEQRLFHNWYTFMRKRFNFSLDAVPVGTWNLHSPPHAKQRDGTSCGVYVLKIAERYLTGESINFAMTAQEIVECRIEIGVKILAGSDPIDDKCRICYRTENLHGDRSWIACDRCGIWLHCQCVGLTGGDCHQEYFQCKMCHSGIRNSHPQQVPTPAGDRLLKGVMNTKSTETASQKEEAQKFFKELKCGTENGKQLIMLLVDVENEEEFESFGHLNDLTNIFYKSTLPKLKEMIARPKNNAKLSLLNKYWRHDLYVQNQHLTSVHNQVNTHPDCLIAGSKMFEENIKLLRYLCLKNLGIFKTVTKRRLGYTNPQFFSVVGGGNDLLAILEDSIAQNMNEGISYFVDVVFPEAEIWTARSMLGISYRAASMKLFPNKKR